MEKCFRGRTKHFRLRWGVALYLQLLAGASIAADFDDGTNNASSFTPFAAFELGNSSNLLGLPNIAAAQAIGAGSSLSDSWQTLQAGILIDKKISLQDIVAEIDVANVHYDRLQLLDHDNKNADIDWIWHAGEHVDGHLGATYKQELTPYIDFHLLDLNLRDQASAFVDASWLFAPSWRVRGGFTDYRLRYDLPSEEPGDRNEARTEFGIDYLPADGSSVGVQVRHIAASFPVPEQFGAVTVPNDYVQDEVKAKIDWNASAITQLHFLGGWVDRKYETFISRNFSGPNARLTADWLPTKLLTFSASTWREIGSVDDLTAAYSLNHGVSVDAMWNISEKLQASGQYKYEREDFGQSAPVAPVPFASGAVRSAALVLTYKVTRKFQLRAAVMRILQSLNDPSSGFSSNSVTLNGRYEF
jgi:exopolysaccharide biosynthesis operon protein EpsL